MRSASPDIFGFSFLTLALSMLLLGGTGTLWGPIVGAVALTVLSELLVDIGPARYLVIATLIVLVLRFFPGGLIGALRQFSRRRPSAGVTSTTEA